MCVCECVCVCVENVVFTTLRRNVRVGRPKKKKKDKMSYICQKQFRFQMNYIFTKGNIPTQIHVLLLFIFTPENDTPFSSESFRGNAVIN